MLRACARSLEDTEVKRLSQEGKTAVRTSRKGSIRPAHSLDHPDRARSARASYPRAGSRSSRHSIASAIGQTGSHPTAERRRSEALFQAAVRNFEFGARAFQRQNYQKAKEIFEKLASSGVAGVAERSLIYLRLCEQKLSHPSPPPKKAEDLYTLGVGALNSRRLDDAIGYLNKAQKSSPKLEHICYALAAAYSLRGDAQSALQHLKEAITLRPQNRIQARRDEDFQALATDARFKELVFASK
jgi:tetratricopeptide (TPR) repeat protein